MKKIIRDLTLVIVGALLVGVPVGAATYISSRDIEYTTEHNENITNVNEALDDLISNVNEIKTSGTATSNEILSGKVAYVNGSKITGSMNNYAGATTSANGITSSGSNAVVSIPEGYYNGSSKINIPLKTIADNIPSIKNYLNKDIVKGSVNVPAGVKQAIIAINSVGLAATSSATITGSIVTKVKGLDSLHATTGFNVGKYNSWLTIYSVTLNGTAGTINLSLTGAVSTHDDIYSVIFIK